MSTATKPPISKDRQLLEVLDALKRQVDLLGWHIGQMRGVGVVEEIDGGLHNVDRALRTLRQSIP